ncbi:MAG: glycosyltransferase family 2 protein [Armatimonadetes bacterium]|nr:glycosyltransferase family 2 protein [Armatimonadota bacterium]
MSEDHMRANSVAIIIPAFNEEARISRVLDAVVRCELADEIIVVCDGSTDHTANVASLYSKVKVVELSINIGKGGAMAMGVAHSSSDIICFVDADLHGLRAEHLDKIITPIVLRQCDMCIGVFRGGQFWSDTAQRISPYISGQRALRRKFFESIPYLEEIRLGVEVTINTFAKRQKLRVQRVVLHGVSNTFKERKLGLVKGTAARAKMYAEIGRAMVRVRRKKERKRRAHRSGN